jgi:hypothetical protein
LRFFGDFGGAGCDFLEENEVFWGEFLPIRFLALGLGAEGGRGKAEGGRRKGEGGRFFGAGNRIVHDLAVEAKVWGLLVFILAEARGGTGYRGRVQDTGFRVQDSGDRIQGTGFRGQDSGDRDRDTGDRGQGAEHYIYVYI